MRTVMITGANGVFGRVLTSSFLKTNKWNVIATARNIPSDEQRKNISWHTLDIRDVNQAKSIFEQGFSGNKNIDVLVNNASAFGNGGSIVDLPIDSIKSDFDVTLLAPIILSKLYVENAKIFGAGKIIFMSSTSALPHEPDHGDYTIYASAKAGITRFSEALNDDIGRYGMSSTVIHPCNMRDYPEDDHRLIEENAVTMESIANDIVAVASKPKGSNTSSIVYRPNLK